jgi:hypothetical protein
VFGHALYNSALVLSILHLIEIAHLLQDMWASLLPKSEGMGTG